MQSRLEAAPTVLPLATWERLPAANVDLNHSSRDPTALCCRVIHPLRGDTAIKGSFFTVIRQLLLITVLAMVVISSYMTRIRSTSWQVPLWVAIYPVNGDGSEKVTDYIEHLDTGTFQSVEQFMISEARRYGVSQERPVRMELARMIGELPPPPPKSGNPLKVGLWSLKIRWWARSITSDQPGPPPDIKLFVVYHDPDQSPVLAHSLGLQKGMLGVVHAFAGTTSAETNNFVITHEMLHTLGASDKYAGAYNLPIFPHGYAAPDKTPLYPQQYAEVMGGRIPLSETEAAMPQNLKQARVGLVTAKEIRWADLDEPGYGRPVEVVSSTLFVPDGA